ncbi:MAG: cation:proton antiporter, partial [Lentisphaeria bacterium]
MLLNLALIILLSLIIGRMFIGIGLPPLLGMIILGFLLGPNCFDLINVKLLAISEELRTAALIIILLRAGLGINRSTLNRIGLSAIKMSFIPCLLEAFFIIIISYSFINNFTIIDSGILAFIIAAVSPAVIVPQMLELKENGFGARKEVPTLVLAGASIDDVFAITFFSAF